MRTASCGLVLGVLFLCSSSVLAADADAEPAAFTAYDTVNVAEGIVAFMSKRADTPMERFAKGDEERGRAFDGFFLGPGFPRAYREAKEGPLKDET